MPTSKRRVTFIPPDDVFEILNTLANNESISLSKIACLLIEESLISKGLIEYDMRFDRNGKKVSDDLQLFNIQKINNHNSNKVINNSTTSYNSNVVPKSNDHNDQLIYKKFLKFLKFEEMLLSNEDF